MKALSRERSDADSNSDEEVARWIKLKELMRVEDMAL